jgi:hypothetical protein
LHRVIITRWGRCLYRMSQWIGIRE